MKEEKKEEEEIELGLKIDRIVVFIFLLEGNKSLLKG